MKMELITPTLWFGDANVCATVKIRQYAYLAVASMDANIRASVTNSEPEMRWMPKASPMIRMPRTACSGHLKSIVTHSNARKRSMPYTAMRAMLAHRLDVVPSDRQWVRIRFIARSSEPVFLPVRGPGSASVPTTPTQEDRVSPLIPEHDRQPSFWTQWPWQFPRRRES